MKKNIFLSVALSIGLMAPVGLESSSWRDSAWQGLASMYRSMPSISQYLSSFPQWLTNLSENQQRKLFIALGAMLGIGGIGYYKYQRSKLSNIATSLGFKNVNLMQLFADNNLMNVAIFLKAEQDGWKVLEGNQDKDSIKCELFMKYIYPILVKMELNNTDVDTLISSIKKNFRDDEWRDDDRYKNILLTDRRDCPGAILQAVEKFHQFKSIDQTNQLAADNLFNVATFLKNEDKNWPVVTRWLKSKDIGLSLEWIKYELFKRKVLPIMEMAPKDSPSEYITTIEKLVEDSIDHYPRMLQENKLTDYMTTLKKMLEQEDKK